jgi:hypothetical protein
MASSCALSLEPLFKTSKAVLPGEDARVACARTAVDKGIREVQIVRKGGVEDAGLGHEHCRRCSRVPFRSAD